MGALDKRAERIIDRGKNNTVFSTFELVIMEIQGVRHTKVWDPESEVEFLKAVKQL